MMSYINYKLYYIYIYVCVLGYVYVCVLPSYILHSIQCLFYNLLVFLIDVINTMKQYSVLYVNTS